MRRACGRHALVEAVDLVTDPEAGQDTGPERVTHDSEAFKKLAEDLPVRRVLWMLASGWTWPWLLEDVTIPAARNRAIRRGLVAPPVGEPDAVLVPYHLTDAGRADLLDWIERITPHRHLSEVDALWRVVTWK
ncbi:hypothetical protein [Lentzea aerocolonigenes]|uniref:hypothetical protein n=1 Tax=Lentzea aerocolonigenes TaxID=68170 RepID=UPI000A76A832|nr:hypothetical protein [Lentzea aerocolonigenes]MCP2248168.1 hypothetical protein [Lentzea aerocolonigenes]